MQSTMVSCQEQPLALRTPQFDRAPRRPAFRGFVVTPKTRPRSGSEEGALDLPGLAALASYKPDSRQAPNHCQF
jgi:hypothetical protein